MKIPKTFVSDKDLEEKTQELAKEREPKKVEDIPENVKTLEDATKYVLNSLVPVYCYDDKKRIHVEELTIKEVFKNQISLGGLFLTDLNPLFYQGFYFNTDKTVKNLSFEICLELKDILNYSITKEGVNKIRSFVEEKKKTRWQLVGIYNLQDLSKYIKIKTNTSKEALWVFETFKNFKPVIHGGSLRDLYLGIERTGDIDVEVSTDGAKGEKELHNLIHKVMDEIEYAEKAKMIKGQGYAHDEIIPSQYRTKKEGVIYDIASGVFPRYLSIEQIRMEQPGELIMHYLTKNDLDNKQFRLIDSYNIPERIVKKIFKLQSVGLTFLPEDPSDLSNKIDAYSLMEKNDVQKLRSNRDYYY